jgi:hypothetical protein
MPRLSELKAKEWAFLFGPFIGSFLVGIGLTYSYPHDWPLSDLIHLVGDAFAVAGVLGIAFDVFVTGRLIDYTAKNLSHRLIGWGLPPELQGEIRKIVDTSLVRENTMKQYRIMNPHDRLVTVEIKLSFNVRNYGDVPQEYSPWLAEEEFYKPEYQYLEYGLLGEKGVTYQGAGLQEIVQTRQDDRAREVTGLVKVIIPPCRTHPQAFCRVAWQYRLTMPESYTDTTSFTGPTLGVRVEIDEVPAGFTFVGDSRYAVRADSGRTWVYTCPFLAHQHIRVRWFRQG